MNRRLNPSLVLQGWPRDRTFPYEEHWVFLRDSKIVGLFHEAGIGPVEIEALTETAENQLLLRRQLSETEGALSTASGIAADREPLIILTRDCFGFSGFVRLLIYSKKPFAD